jgi:hypothetical protein
MPSPPTTVPIASSRVALASSGGRSSASIAEGGALDESEPTAMDAYARALEASPKYPGLKVLQARELLRDGSSREEEALALLDEEEANHPGMPETRRLRKQILKRREAEARNRARESERALRELDYERQQEESQRKRQESVERFRTQNAEIGGVFCQLEGYRAFGKEFGGDLHSSVASGTFVGVLLQCVNGRRSTVYFPAEAFAIVDAHGRRFAIDTNSSFDLAIWKNDAEINNPEALQLHPGIPRFVQLMFDIPPDAAQAPTTRLAFASKTMQLIFEEGAEP